MTDYSTAMRPVIDGRTRTLCCHSGTLSGELPPNSLAAVAECVEARVPRLEVDVRFMADDAMLIFHDASLDRDATGSGSIGDLERADVAGVRYRSDERHRLCFLEEVVDVLRGTETKLQVDLKLMRPISPERAARLTDVLRPLGDCLIVGSQAHWNLRRLENVPIAFDPTLHWHYDPKRTSGEAWPRTLGLFGLWDDAPLASIRQATPQDYVASRVEDIRRLVPSAVEWMVDFATIERLASFGVSLGEVLLEEGCALAAWTLREDTPGRAKLAQNLISLGVETIITDAPMVLAADLAVSGFVNRL